MAILVGTAAIDRGDVSTAVALSVAAWAVQFVVQTFVSIAAARVEVHVTAGRAPRFGIVLRETLGRYGRGLVANLPTYLAGGFGVAAIVGYGAAMLRVIDGRLGSASLVAGGGGIAMLVSLAVALRLALGFGLAVVLVGREEGLRGAEAWRRSAARMRGRYLPALVLLAMLTAASLALGAAVSSLLPSGTAALRDPTWTILAQVARQAVALGVAAYGGVAWSLFAAGADRAEANAGRDAVVSDGG